MSKNIKNNPTSTLSAGVQSRFLELQSAFAGKGFWGKLIVSVLMIVALLSFALEGSFLLLSSVFSGLMSVMGDKTTVRMSKAVRKNNPKAFKSVFNGKVATDGLDNITRSITSSIGGKLDVLLHDQLSTLTKRATLKKYFKLLKIKDKQAIQLVKSSSCQSLLTSYNKTHGSVMSLEKLTKENQLAKKANKKNAKKTRKTVLNATSWSTTGSPRTFVQP